MDSNALGWWEMAEYGATAIVMLGCIGEGIVDFTNCIKGRANRRLAGRAALIVLIVGLAAEILTQAKVNRISGREIATLNSETQNTLLLAGKLGVRIDTLHDFVANKTREYEADRAKYQALIGALDNDKRQFEAASAASAKAQADAKKNLDSLLKQAATIASVVQQVKEDHSVKTRIRGLLASVDRRVPGLIDSGQTELTVRMEPNDIQTLQSLIAEPGGSGLIGIEGYAGRMIDSVIDNGTLGPTGAVHDQIGVRLKIGAGLKN